MDGDPRQSSTVTDFDFTSFSNEDLRTLQSEIEGYPDDTMSDVTKAAHAYYAEHGTLDMEVDENEMHAVNSAAVQSGISPQLMQVIQQATDSPSEYISVVSGLIKNQNTAKYSLLTTLADINTDIQTDSMLDSAQRVERISKHVREIDNMQLDNSDHAEISAVKAARDLLDVISEIHDGELRGEKASLKLLIKNKTELEMDSQQAQIDYNKAKGRAWICAVMPLYGFKILYNYLKKSLSQASLDRAVEGLDNAKDRIVRRNQQRDEKILITSTKVTGVDSQKSSHKGRSVPISKLSESQRHAASVTKAIPDPSHTRSRGSRLSSVPLSGFAKPSGRTHTWADKMKATQPSPYSARSQQTGGAVRKPSVAQRPRQAPARGQHSSTYLRQQRQQNSGSRQR